MEGVQVADEPAKDVELVDDVDFVELPPPHPITSAVRMPQINSLLVVLNLGIRAICPGVV